ncbi:hypothetical protein P40081_27440 [Paenibacillus sp. FSL P4-0081]|uniref:type II toxin-antitoxin system RelE/ParE family toxin n=1 Tax=unclassified Paenibacillus TaxID=185978 RepID=UPI0004F67BB1|nr:type II toxin-antitoxin system RelE/ParE family toxin [Paenibacillus sp. FSL P4-0081]AIQ31473.1 hypothetical protein P40081_27440 [Paenibacillus sp. FSL P4-0081]
MSFNIIITPVFEEDLEFYKKKRKAKKIDEDVNEIIQELKKGNFIGDEIQNLKLPEDESSYKVRAANSDMRVGKSAGYRIVYYVVKNDQDVYLLTIYSKKDKDNITANEISDIINTFCKD